MPSRQTEPGVSLALCRQVPHREEANMLHGPGQSITIMSQMVKPYPSHSAPHYEGP